MAEKDFVGIVSEFFASQGCFMLCDIIIYAAINQEIRCLYLNINAKSAAKSSKSWYMAHILSNAQNAALRMW
jgi:hypothetical protein